MLIITVILILCATALCGFFGREGERFMSAWIGFVGSVSVAISVWFLYGVVHFMNKYW